MLPKFDGRRRYNGVLPNFTHLREIFSLAPETGTLFYNYRPEAHFKNIRDCLTWNEENAEYCIEPDPKWDDSIPMKVVFYYEGGLRSCYAYEIIFSLLGFEYCHWLWDVKFQDGNSLNTKLDNLKVVDRKNHNQILGYLFDFKERNGVFTFGGVFPTKEGMFSAFSYKYQSTGELSFDQRVSGGESTHPRG